MREAQDARTFEDALRVARMYYTQDFTTGEIAQRLGVSRPKVSRLLTWAKQNGLVEIRVRDHREHQWSLERELEARHGVERVKVVPLPPSADEAASFDAVTRFAAHYLDGLMRQRTTLALAWGNTVAQVGRTLVRKPAPGSHVVQMSGSGNSGTGITYAADIVMRFADTFDATPALLPMPAYFDDPATKEAVFRERSIRRVRELAFAADVELFSIGVPDADSYIYRAGYVERDDLDALRADGVVGDVATMFFRADGSWEDVAMNARSSGPPLSTLARCPHAICVVEGSRKRDGILGALRGGFMNTLIVDEPTARSLL